MLYHSRGIGQGFSGDYNDYFGLNTDDEAVAYLTLAHYMIHTFYPHAITVAEVNRPTRANLFSRILSNVLAFVG